MNTYHITTQTTMKEYNCKNWWIMPDVIKGLYIEAETVNKALTEYAETVRGKYGIDVSKTALRNKNPMYIDTADGTAKQIGYVITGSTDFDKGDYTGWVKQYVDLWVKIETVTETIF